MRARNDAVRGDGFEAVGALMADEDSSENNGRGGEAGSGAGLSDVAVEQW